MLISIRWFQSPKQPQLWIPCQEKPPSEASAIAEIAINIWFSYFQPIVRTCDSRQSFLWFAEQGNSCIKHTPPKHNPLPSIHLAVTLQPATTDEGPIPHLKRKNVAKQKKQKQKKEQTQKSKKCKKAKNANTSSYVGTLDGSNLLGHTRKGFPRHWIRPASQPLRGWLVPVTHL